MFVGGFEAHHQNGLSVGRAQEPPAFRKNDAHTVDVHRRVGLLEVLRDARHQFEFDLVRTVHADLGRGYHLGNPGQLRRERPSGLGDDFDQAARGVERVVVAAVAIAEKHVAGHFARQFGVLLFHFGFDQRVAGFIHDAVAAQFGDLIVHHLRAFHLADERRAGLPLKDLARVNQEQQIAVDDVAVLVDGADAV